MALLETKNLHTYFKTRRGIVKAVNGVSYAIEPGKTLGVVGESGSGKSVSAMSILRLLDGNGYVDSGEILFDGKDLTKIPMSEMYHIRGNQISVIFQEPMTALNPVFSVERQLSEPFIIHRHMSKKQAAEAAVKMLADVKIPNPEVVVKQYPHQLSGGMRQRVMIAMAMSSDPKILIADEPTTALDVTIQAQILHLLLELQKKNNMSIILITHDLGVVAQTCKRVAVMCGGYVVEEGTVEEIFLHPGHPYTQALITSMPRVGGTFEQFLERDLSDGNGDLCPFLNRCKYADKTCEACLPKYYEASEGHRIFCHRREEKR